MEGHYWECAPEKLSYLGNHSIHARALGYFEREHAYFIGYAPTRPKRLDLIDDVAAIVSRKASYKTA